MKLHLRLLKIALLCMLLIIKIAAFVSSLH